MQNKGCGREIDADSVYCKWCGTRQVREQRSKNTAHTPTARKLPSGSWACRVRVNGRDVSITRETKEEAIAEAMAIKHGLKAPDKPRTSMTLAEAYTSYIRVPRRRLISVHRGRIHAPSAKHLPAAHAYEAGRHHLEQIRGYLRHGERWKVPEVYRQR